MQGRLTSSHFVGRQSALAELELAFREADSERPALILIGGESGVGKTRLVSEAQRSFDEALVLRGECLEQGDGELPYAPLLGALRPLVRERDPILSELSPGSLARLGALLPSLGEAGLSGSGPDSDGTGQVRLFEALLELLHLLSARRSLVLIMEDMHWADRSTRTFAAFLARSLGTERILVLFTYRSDELHRRHPLRPLLAELDRLERTRRIDLDPFDREEIAEALLDILGRTADEELVDRMLARSEGNPLYIEELLVAALDGRGAAPQSLRDAFMLRIERLSPDARLAAQAVAVGLRLDQASIAAVSGISSERLRAALRETVTEHVLVAAEDGRFHFRHALLREVLYDDLLPGERGDLHIGLAHTLEQASEPGACAEDAIERVASIATHYAAAGDQTAALRATVRAAHEAKRVHAYGEVADLAERAMELWPRVPDPEPIAGLDHVDLLELAASGHGMAGDRARSATLREHALSEMDPELEPLRYGRVLAKLAKMYWSLNRGPEGLEAARRALAMLPEDDSGAERAELLSWLARTRVLRGHYREAITEGEMALSVASSGGYEPLVGEVLSTLGMARIALGQVDDGEQQLRQAIQVYRDLCEDNGLGSAHSNLADFLSLAGRTPDALKVIESGLSESAVKLGRTYLWMEITRAMLAFEAGDWELARTTSRPPTASLVGVMFIFSLLVDAEMALGEGHDQLAAAALAAAEPLVRVTSEAQWHGHYGSLLAELERRHGGLDQARTTVARALDELEVCTDDVMRIARVTAVGLSIEADRALKARDLKQADELEDALERVRIHLERLKAAAQDGGRVEQAWFLVGRAEAARARGRNEDALWQAATESWDDLGRPYPAAIARWRRAEALLEAGDRAQASDAAAGAAAVARELGAGWLSGEVETLIARGRLNPAGDAGRAYHTAEDPDRDRPRSDELPFGLTPREFQVLALLADGSTNRQIGAALFMAEKTASVHVSRILAKLDVQTRTQAAAVAHRMRLSESSV